MTVKNWACRGYLVAVHLVLAVLLVKDDVIGRLQIRAGLRPAPQDPFVATMRAQHARLDAAIPQGSVLFLGDSNMQSMPASEVSDHAVNLGIAGQRSDQLLKSMAGYKSIERAAAVVVMIGSNDVTHGQLPEYAAVLSLIPAAVPVVLASVPPRVGSDVRPAVDTARTACYARVNCTFVDAFAALDGRPGVLLRDGVHLTPSGYAVLIPLLRNALAAGHSFSPLLTRR